MTAMKFQFAKDKKEKALLSILVMTVIVAVYFQVFFRPVIKDAGTILPKVSRLKADLRDAKFLISRKETIEEEGRSLKLKKDRYEKIFPSQEEIPRLLESLSEMAGKSGVKIIGIKPLSKEETLTEEHSEVYREIPIEIMARSGYHQLGQFLQNLETGERFIMVKDLEISTSTDNVKTHNARLIASTYILVKE